MSYESKLLEEEKQRLQDVGQKAGDKVSSLTFVPRNNHLTVGQLAELSEATLETVSSTVDVLKGVRLSAVQNLCLSNMTFTETCRTAS